MYDDIVRRGGKTKADFKRTIGEAPSTRKGFDDWADALSEDDMYRIWFEQEADWNKIASRIRGSKRMHEWMMIESLPDLRKIGVSMKDIRGVGFGSPTGAMKVHWPGATESVTHRQGGEILQAFHLALARTIEAAAVQGDADLLFRNIGDLADDWLDGGRNALPKDLLERVRDATMK